MACTLDFRCLDEGLGGAKNKRKRQDEEGGSSSMDLDQSEPSSKRAAVASSSDPNRPSPVGRPTYDGVIAGKASGRRWKLPRPRRTSATLVSTARTTPEQRAHDRELKRAFRARKEELKEEIRKHKVEKREKREEREKRKKENILRSGTKLQVISNPKTLKKIAKSKKKKLLRVVPDNIVNKGKKAADAVAAVAARN